MSSTTTKSNPGAFIIYFGMLAVLGALLAYGVYTKPITTAMPQQISGLQQ